MDRRQFLSCTALGLTAASYTRALGSANRLTLGIMGTGGRGIALAKAFARQPDVEVRYVCDVDQRRMHQAAEATAQVAGTAPREVGDFRRILDDRQVDALVIATCNHWHAPATILACAAGKHVYVEKPCSHNAREGELMVQAAHKYRRLVQMGNQRRSWPSIREAIERLQRGELGRVFFAQAWYFNRRPSIGRGQAAEPPAWLDYDLWQGPAPRRPFRTNYLHYNWHWFWHWGNGELGNNGVHMIDLCRWGLGVDYPVRVTSSGGCYRYQDDQETPDTHTVCFDFSERRSIVWQGFSCIEFPRDGVPQVLFQGEKGSLAIRGTGYTLYDPAGKEIGRGGDQAADIDSSHIHNFLEAIRDGTRLNSDIVEAHKSTLLCHLGNIAYRVGRSLVCDPATGHIQGDKEAAAHWSREYQKGWEPVV